MNTIVACIDGASHTEGVCDYAVWAALRVGAPLEFLHVLVRRPDPRLDASGSIGMGAQDELMAELAALDERRNTLAREHGRQLLEGARERALAAGVPTVTVQQRHGELVDNLIDMQEGTRLYVLGQHDRPGKPRRFLLDHNLESAVRALHRPILVATSEFQPPHSFMIAFDASATTRKMVEMVADSPILRGMSCVVATVGGDETALSWAQERLSLAGFQPRLERLEGEPADALLEYAEHQQIDMLVMGAYGHSRIRQLVVGSTTTSLLRRARMPVFVLR